MSCAREINNALKPEVGAVWTDFTHAYFVVDARGKVLGMNSAAEALLTRPGSPLRLGGGVLRATMADDIARLGNLIGASCASLEDSRSNPGGMMIASTGDDAPLDSRLLLSVSPMPQGGWLVLQHQRCALVLVRTLQVGTQSTMAASLSGLSSSQARLAAGFATGLSLQDVATSLGISYGTARRYLEEIFRKTATRRQPELVALLKTLEATQNSER